MPLTRACLSRSSAEASRQALTATSVLSFFLTFSANLSSRSVASGRRLRTTSSTCSSKSFSLAAPMRRNDVLDMFEQVLGDFLVHLKLAGIDDAHIEAGFDRVIQ